METMFQNSKMKRSIKSVILLLIAAAIWGFAFVAQDVASGILPPFTITGVRSIIGFIFLMIVATINSKVKKEKLFYETKEERKALIIVSIVCGTCFAFAYNFQQFGIALYPDDVAVSGRAGFLTGLYVLFVPVIGFIFFKKKIKLNVIISLVLAIIGLYLLCFSNGINNVYLGDLVILICGIFFALQIIYVDKYNGKVDVLKFAAYELLVCGVLSLIFAFIFEKIIIADILRSIVPLLYLGIFSCAVADTCQIIGQKLSSNPTVDAIVMSFESVFASIGGLLLLDQIPLINEIIGCVIMFVAIILSQITFNCKKELQQINKNGENNV